MPFFLPRPSCLAGALLGAATLSLAAQGTATAPAPAAHPSACPAKPMTSVPTGKPAAGLLDINAASRQELTKLPGVTEPLARRIIAGRPYLSKAKLVSRHVISMDLFQRIRTLIVVNPAPAPKP